MEEKTRSKTITTESIDLIVYDFDGVMTDNRVFVLQNGTEAVIANRSDGLGVDRFREISKSSAGLLRCYTTTGLAKNISGTTCSGSHRGLCAGK